MTNAIHYLEAARADQVAHELEAQGFHISRRPAAHEYDLIATKGGKKIAIEVKARATLGASAQELRRLREQALQQGYDEFRIVVATPPRAKTIVVAGLHQQLADYLTEHIPHNLYEIAPNVYVQRLQAVDIDHITVNDTDTRAIGTAMATIEFDGVANQKAWHEQFPLTFDVQLNPALVITYMHALEVDTSSFWD